MPDEVKSETTTPEATVVGSRPSIREEFDAQVKAANLPDDEATEPTVTLEVKEEEPKHELYQIDEKLSPEERMEKLLEIDESKLSPADLAKFKKDIHKGFTQSTQRASQRVRETEEKLTNLQKLLKDHEPLLKMWRDDPAWRESVVKYVQGSREQTTLPSQSRFNKFLEGFSDAQRESLSELYSILKEDLRGETKPNDNPEVRKELAYLKSHVALEQQTRIKQMEKRFHSECPAYKELPAFWQKQFELVLQTEFKRDPEQDPVEIYRAFEKELSSFSAKDRSKQLDELSTRANRVPSRPDSVSGTTEPKFTPGEVAKQAFWHHMRQRGK